MAHTRKEKDVTEFQEALLGFLKEISTAIKDEKMAMDQKIANILKVNEQMMQLMAKAAMLGVSLMEKSLAEKLTNALNITLSDDYAENDRRLKVLRGEIKDIKKILNEQQQKPRM